MDKMSGERWYRESRLNQSHRNRANCQEQTAKGQHLTANNQNICTLAH
jgi:hypothetical protein